LDIHCASIVLNIAVDQAEEFERGFKEHELPTHRDLYERGLLVFSWFVEELSEDKVV